MPVAGRLGIELLPGAGESGAAAAAFRLLDLFIPGENIFFFLFGEGGREKGLGFFFFLQIT